MKLTKIIALLLCGILCISCLASCFSSDEGDVDEDEIEEEEKEEEKDKNEDKDKETLEHNHGGAGPSVNYNKDKFTFLNVRQASGNVDYYGGNWLDVESKKGSVAEKAVYERNRKVEEELGVEITQIIEDGTEPEMILETYYKADDVCFDVVYGWGAKMFNCIPMGYFRDVSSLPNTDFSEDYWSQDSIEDLSVCGKSYVFTNDITMNRLGWSNVLFFNPQIAEDYNVYKDIGNFYELVEEGKWTLDKYLAAVSSVQHDLDGNGTVDVSDVYGLIDGGAIGDSLGLSCGVRLITEDESYIPNITFYSDKTLDIANRVYEVYSKACVMSYQELTEGADIPEGMNDIFQYSRSFFAKGHSLFMSGGLQLCSELRDMDEYGILPLPKYDENQENYITPVDPLASMFALPAEVRADVESASLERTGTVLERMAAQSKDEVLPIFISTVFPERTSDYKKKLDMIDIISSSISYDRGCMLSMSYDSALENIAGVYTHIFHSPASAASTYTRNQKLLNNAIETFYMDVLGAEG
ncbi:MAG: hypothetical protein E7647_01715 [Ruminococcaceae bacterium]|nr:hypothetical protein [Oscillospiraceae bacterium]